MYISKITVANYKCFLEPTTLELGPGFNVIVGQNSSGKTALLEALSLSFGHVPHRSAFDFPGDKGLDVRCPERGRRTRVPSVPLGAGADVIAVAAGAFRGNGVGHG